MVYQDILLSILELAAAVGLYLLAGYAVKALSPYWKLCYAAPVVICLFGVTAYGFEISMAGLYLGAVLLLAGFFREEEKLRKKVCGAAGAVMLLSVLVCNVNAGYRAPDYGKDFKQGFAEMKAHYALTAHKGIDWDGLYAKYLPQFEEIDKSHDADAAHLAWHSFAMEFNDGHVAYSPGSESTLDRVFEQVCGNDYGLSLMTLANGQTAAVNVEPGSAAEAAGIGNGTIITAWDGMPVEEAVQKAEESCIRLQNFASRENEAFYRAMPAAGMGGESVTVSYLDDSGKESTVTLEKLGAYFGRWKESLEILDKGAEISNLAWQDVDDKTVLLRMRFMNYDAKENFAAMEEEIRTKLLEYRAAGVENLIFDLRSNGGGSGSHVKHILKLIAPEGENTYAFDGVFDSGTMQYKKGSQPDTYETGERESYQGEDLWGHGKIVVLVNAQTVSAGDHFTRLASDFPNVTVMGFTHSNCSAQGINGVKFSYGFLSYSAVLLLEEDGTVFIDTGADREASVPLDVQIPFDGEAAKAVFGDGEDYVLRYAQNYLKKK